VDTFQNGLTAGWSEGAASLNPPTVVSDGGPGGAGDAYLQNISSGFGSGGGRMVEFNQDQWTGDYAAAHVTRISMDLANLGSTPLAIRVSIQGQATGTRFASTDAFPLPPDGGSWHHATFLLTPAALTSVGGPDPLATVLGNVSEVRILSAANGPTFIGDSVAGTLGVDNVRALRLQGDANFDGVVGPGDFNLLASNFGKTTGATWQEGDFNFDGSVGPGDFNLLASNFGQSDGGVGAQGLLPASISTVPEPGAISVAVFLGGAIVSLHRRKRIG
jgi:hypothetical protein